MIHKTPSTPDVSGTVEEGMEWKDHALHACSEAPGMFIRHSHVHQGHQTSGMEEQWFFQANLDYRVSYQQLGVSNVNQP